MLRAYGNAQKSHGVGRHPQASAFVRAVSLRSTRPSLPASRRPGKGVIRAKDSDIGVDDAGADGVDSDVVGGEGARQRLGKADERRF